MKLLRRFLVTCLALCTLLLIISFTAFAGDGDTIEISTPGELMDILNTAPSEAWDTSGKTYVLQSDIEIDTSGLSATYYSTDNSKTRNFMGVLDGGGHTITVVENADGEPSKPLFDRITGTSENDYAGIKNLNVVFKGDVEGATLASTLTCAQINDVKITFEKNIIFAEPLYGSSGQYAIATGVFGFPTQSTPIILNNVSVVGKGIIGSKDAHDKAYVMAAGIFSESNFSAGDIIFDGIDVNVKGIYAVSNYKPAPSAYSDCCAAGIASGWSQVNLNLGNAYVNISDDIYAHSTNGSDADAYGLGYHLLSMYNCDVKVGGNIEARADSQTYINSYNSTKSEYTVSASGMCYKLTTKYNNRYFGSNDIGICKVVVKGDIYAQAKSDQPADAGYKATASGISTFTSPENTNTGISIESKNIVSYTEGYTSAYAVGFSYQATNYYNNTGDAFDYRDCSVKADKISAYSNGYGGYSAGFMFWGYASYYNCDVSVNIIESYGIESASSGFVYRFSPNPSRGLPDKHGEIDGCTVSVESITSENTDSDYGSEVSGLVGEAYNMALGTTGTIRNCYVSITDQLSAKGYNCIKSLLVELNRSSYEIYDNTVELPLSQADVQTIDGKQYVLFTASERSGRARESLDTASSWESGNRVIFTGKSINAVFCRYDDGSTNGTLWELKELHTFSKVSYDLDGGDGAKGIDYDDEYIISGEEATLKDAPTKEHFIFMGWSDGENTYQPGDKAVINTDVTFKAIWESDGSSPEGTYTLEYETNGGRHIDSETKDHAWTKDKDDLPTPERNGYKFKGWYLDAELTDQVGNEIEIDKAVVTLYAKWSRSSGSSYELPKTTGVEKLLDTQNHTAYLNGYPDGSFQPDGNMTRAEVAQMFYNLLLDKDIDTTPIFSDVSDDAWYSEAVNTLAALDIVNGVVDGIGSYIYEPDRAVTRAEFTAIAMRFAELETGGENIFIDVNEDDWFYDHVIGSIQYGWINGYPDGTFRPNNPITRAEVTVITNNMLERFADIEYIDNNGDIVYEFYDTDKNHWAYYSIAEATNHHEYMIDTDNENWYKVYR